MLRVRRVAICLVGILLASCLMALAAEKPAPVPVPSINDQAQNSPLGSRHWNIFRNVYNNPADPEQSHCIGCHSAVAIVDDPNAKLTDFLHAGDEYCIEELDDVAPGQSPFVFAKATETGKYVDNEFEGITCRVCHVMDKDGLTLRRPDKTCTLCHGRSFNWARGSGHHVEQAFLEGQGEGYWAPSVHFTLGIKCESCHTMNSVKHDYEPADPADIVKNAFCANCHYDAEELAVMIEETQDRVVEGIEAIAARIKTAKAGEVSKATGALLSKAQARIAFIEDDFSEGVHNPQFAAQLINEANAFLDQVDKAAGKDIESAVFDMSDLMVYSEAQTSHLGSAHWDMLENTVSNMADPDQDHCIKCHSAVAIVDDPNAKVADFLPAGAQYCVEELEDIPAGESPFVMGTTEKDGKYLANRVEGITCRVCHTFGKDGNILLRRNDEQTCGLCHGRTFNWNTGSGHHVELAFTKGQGSTEKGVPDMPSVKYKMGFACQDCHFMDDTKHDYEPATADQIAANPKCSPCHTAKEVGKMVEEIREEVEVTIAKLLPRLEKAGSYVANHPGNAEAKEMYTQAKAGVTFVEDDFSEGVHNPEFARYLLKRSKDLLDQFEKAYK